MADDFRLGFRNLEQETIDREVPVASGSLPAWLSGALIRTGPAIFDLPDQSYRHWFDGLAMLQKFAMHEGKVRYTGKFLRSEDYKRTTAGHGVRYDEFATVPKRNLLRRILTLLEPERQFGRNGMVNVQKLSDACFIAMTENPNAIQFDPKDLSTIGPFEYPDGLMSILNMITTAHPVLDPSTGTVYNFVVRLMPFAPRYIMYAIDRGQLGRRVVGEIKTDAISYMHGLGISEHYLILVEYPLVVHPMELFLMPLNGTPFIENYRWEPERGTRIRVMDKRDGRLVGTWETDAMFAFHHVHAQETGDELIVDLSVYDHGPAIIDHFYLDRLRKPGGGEIAYSGLRRLRIPLKGASKTVVNEKLAEPMFEMPQLNWDRCSAGAYRYTYGVSYSAPGNFVDSLVKIDVSRGTHTSWHEPGCNPGEPVFVPEGPNAAEDAGVALSIVLDAKAGRSFLLALDSQSFQERARVMLPHAIPFMLHGQYFPGVR